jgi:hypothetical protein
MIIIIIIIDGWGHVRNGWGGSKKTNELFILEGSKINNELFNFEGSKINNELFNFEGSKINN